MISLGKSKQLIFFAVCSWNLTPWVTRKYNRGMTESVVFTLFLHLKDQEWKERRLRCRWWWLQILIQSLRQSLHELHFWSANKLAFYFILSPFLALPALKIKGTFRWIKTICSFNCFFSLLSAPFLSPKLNFPPICSSSRVSLLCNWPAIHSAAVV